MNEKQQHKTIDEIKIDQPAFSVQSDDALQITENSADAQNFTSKKGLMLAAMEKSLGIVTIACKAAGISRRTHYDWMTNDQAYALAVNKLDDLVLDFAENHLHKLVQDGDTAATIFLLKTKGKKRGYIERQELELQNSIDIKWEETRTYDIEHKEIAADADRSSDASDFQEMSGNNGDV